MTEDDLQKIRADYAWKWFDLHAKQRMTLFNYFLIIAGIFANAIMLSFKDGPSTFDATTQPAAIMQPAAPPPTTAPFILNVNQFVTNGNTSPVSANRGDTMTLIRRAIGVLGAFAAIAFIVFDVRSRALTKRSEDVLEQLERDLIFTDTYKFTGDGSSAQLGILRCERDDEMREGQKRSLPASLTKMKWWIWALEGLIGLGFLATLFM